MGDLGQCQIVGSLGDPAIFKSRGVSSTLKRYVGHRGLGSNSVAHPGPSLTSAPFAPTMSVRIFGHFLPCPVFLARRALCSAHRGTPDACKNGQHMVCNLCTLVPMTHRPGGRTEALTHKELCQGDCGQFCNFCTCGYNSSSYHAMAFGDLWDPSTCEPPLDSHCVPR